MKTSNPITIKVVLEGIEIKPLSEISEISFSSTCSAECCAFCLVHLEVIPHSKQYYCPACGARGHLNEKTK